MATNEELADRIRNLENDMMLVRDGSIIGGLIVDQSSSDYIRIGNFQICWGDEEIQLTATHYGNVAVTYSVTFKSGSYPRISTTCKWDVADILSGFESDNHTGFTLKIAEKDGVAKTGLVHTHWVAIGVWR